MSTIVVGVDGSPAAVYATGLAAREAARRGASLRIVHAFIWPLMHVPLGPSPEGPPEGGLSREAERILEEAAAAARMAAPGVAVSTDIVVSAPAPALLKEARDAQLIVVGDRGLGGFTGLLLGSVAVHLVSHSAVPVLVARGMEHPHGPVLLGVDGSPESGNAVEAAFREAAERDAVLVAVHTWTGPVSAGAGDMLPLVYDPARVEQEESRVLAEALSGYRERWPEVKVETRTVSGPASRELLRLSDEAQLLVVGSHGRGGFTGLLLGSVSQQILHHSHCPVLMVPRVRRS